jgi:hypothetical protein
MIIRSFGLSVIFSAMVFQFSLHYRRRGWEIAMLVVLRSFYRFFLNHTTAGDSLSSLWFLGLEALSIGTTVMTFKVVRRSAGQANSWKGMNSPSTMVGLLQ